MASRGNMLLLGLSLMSPFARGGDKVTDRPYHEGTRVLDVVNDPVFRGFGRRIFPVHRRIPDDMTLSEVGDLLVWYSGVRAESTVAVCNDLRSRAAAADTVFLEIYSEEEQKADPAKRATGLFFFRGRQGAKTAILNAGGGFMYVGAMHDSFPHALHLARRGINAFAIVYRPDARAACEDLARTIVLLHDRQTELGIDMRGYSLWGGSAGARMAAWLGSLGTASFGERRCPRPAAVIMQYTGLSEVFGNEPATWCCVGTADGIASWRTMERRVAAIRAAGTDAEIEVFEGLPHGFGLGIGTVAEGWIDRAVRFWERQGGRN